MIYKWRKSNIEVFTRLTTQSRCCELCLDSYFSLGLAEGPESPSPRRSETLGRGSQGDLAALSSGANLMHVEGSVMKGLRVAWSHPGLVGHTSHCSPTPSKQLIYVVFLLPNNWMDSGWRHWQIVLIASRAHAWILYCKWSMLKCQKSCAFFTPTIVFFMYFDVSQARN